LHQSFQTTLFITKVEVGNIVDEYQSALFSGQIQMNRSDKKNVSLNNVKAPISWTTILLFILGMIITIYSLLYKKLHILKILFSITFQYYNLKN